MDASAWIAIVGVVMAGFVQTGAIIWWAATTSARVKALEDSLKDHGELRDVVIELRSDMRNFAAAVKDMGEAIRELRAPSPARRRQQASN